MEFVIFPPGLLDLPAVCDLPSEHKLLLSFVVVNPQTSACGVLTATKFVAAKLPLPMDVFWGIVDDLDRREVVVADVSTGEIFVSESFAWHRAPTPDENTGWSRQVAAAAARIRSSRVRDAVGAALAHPPSARLPTLKTPTNLLTALPPRGRGKGWSATETLVHFAAATNPDQTAAGVFVPNVHALAAFCSLPSATLLECVDSLGAARLLTFDGETGELFCPARLRAAQERDVGKIQRLGEDVRSWAVFRALAEAAKRRFSKITIKSKCCPLGDFMGVEGKGVEFRPGFSEAVEKARSAFPQLVTLVPERRA